jgi:hypothetical protein
MSECKRCRELFAESFYGELNPDQRHFLENHLKNCPKCSQEFAEMESTLKIMDKRIRPEPGQAFWDGFGKRVAQRIEEEKPIDVKVESRWRTFIQGLSFAPKWAFQAAAAALLIVVGVFIGRTVFSPDVSKIQQAQQPRGIVSQQQPGLELISRTQNYIERSKLILLAIINFDPQTEDPYGLNLPYQKQVSRELVEEASFLKKRLADADERRLQSLITDLEVILLQIANLESGEDSEAIELVKDGVESRGVLLKIHITDIRQSLKKMDKSVPSQPRSNTT